MKISFIVDWEAVDFEEHEQNKNIIKYFTIHPLQYIAVILLCFEQLMFKIFEYYAYFLVMVIEASINELLHCLKIVKVQS